MKRFLLFALSAAALVVLAAPPDARACHRRYYGGCYAPAYYYCPAPVYYMPAYYSCPSYPYYTYPPPRRPVGAVVEVGAYDGRGFEPKVLTVAPGTLVRWVNRGQEAHTVTSREGKFDSGPLAPGATFSVLFVTPGPHHYFCRPHEKMGMVGTVIVGSVASGGQADQVTHEGTFVSARGEKGFVMEDKGKEHSHTLAPDARVIGPDGKEVKITALAKGQKIRVTTRKGDMTTALKVEALKPR